MIRATLLLVLFAAPAMAFPNNSFQRVKPFPNNCFKCITCPCSATAIHDLAKKEKAHAR